MKTLRMNLNTRLRHAVFDQPEGVSLRFSTGSERQPDANAFRLITSQKEMVTIVDYVANRIVDESAVRRGKQFLYQIVCCRW